MGIPISEALPSILIGICSMGMAAGFFLAEPRSPTTRSLALVLFLNGWSFVQGPWTNPRYFIEIVRYIDVAVVALAGCAFAEWLLRVARTAQPTPTALAWITAGMRLCQVLSASYLVTGCVFLHDLYNYFFAMGLTWNDLQANPVLWIFIAQLVAALFAFIGSATLLFFQQVDPVERVRAIALAIAMPFFAGGVILSSNAGAVSNMLAQLIVLSGALRYHAMQGERGQFMSKFLSPQVERVVRLKGLAFAMQPQSLEITAVSCDLRGFTRFSQAYPSEAVIQLLGQYYEAVGAVVARLGATIKDYAGDGILMLVGAPVADQNHAVDGLALAREVSAAAREVVRRWSSAEHPLGVGVGVASGRVTVGGIGSASRLEYTAVGPAVNLSSRLCALALDGQVLVDERTAELARDDRLCAQGETELKGFGSLPYFAAT